MQLATVPQAIIQIFILKIMGGCVGQTSQNHPKKAYASLSQQAMRVKLGSEQQQLKLSAQLKKQEDLLIQAFGNDPAVRSMSLEKALIGRTVYTYHRILIYRYIENEAKRLLQSKQLFEKWETFQGLLPCVHTIVYASQFLNDERLQKFTMVLKSKYPQYTMPQDSNIRIQLIKHHKKTESVTFEMENTYMLQFCNKYSIQMTRINQAGHNYRYGAGTVNYSVA